MPAQLICGDFFCLKMEECLSIGGLDQTLTCRFCSTPPMKTSFSTTQVSRAFGWRHGALCVQVSICEGCFVPESFTLSLLQPYVLAFCCCCFLITRCQSTSTAVFCPLEICCFCRQHSMASGRWGGGGAEEAGPIPTPPGSLCGALHVMVPES